MAESAWHEEGLATIQGLGMMRISFNRTVVFQPPTFAWLPVIVDAPEDDVEHPAQGFGRSP